MNRLAMLAIAALCVAGCNRDSRPLAISDAWIREAPPGSPMAGYLQLGNRSEATIRCDAASSQDFGAVELHRTVVENGMSRMLHGEIAEVPPGGTLSFEPGSYHLMLFRPARSLGLGDVATITLHCGELRTTAEFTVRAP